MYNSYFNSFLFHTLPAQGTVTHIVSFSNTRISGQAFNNIKDKIKIGLSKASGVHPDLITLQHQSGNSFFTVTYVIFDDTTKAAVKTTIDHVDFVTTLRTELNKQEINSLTITTVAASEDVDLDGKNCMEMINSFLSKIFYG